MSNVRTIIVIIFSLLFLAGGAVVLGQTPTNKTPTATPTPTKSGPTVTTAPTQKVSPTPLMQKSPTPTPAPRGAPAAGFGGAVYQE